MITSRVGCAKLLLVLNVLALLMLVNGAAAATKRRVDGRTEER
jgi:hypothetical protein